MVEAVVDDLFQNQHLLDPVTMFMYLPLEEFVVQLQLFSAVQDCHGKVKQSCLLFDGLDDT